MNAGPSGFAGAPLSKALFLATLGSSAAAQLAAQRGGAPLGLGRRRPSGGAAALARAFAFSRPGELLFGAALAYHLSRLFERRLGTGRYGAWVGATGAAALALQGAAAAWRRRAPAPGPYWLLLPHLVAFALDVPPLRRVPLPGGLSLSDKAPLFVAAAQLVLAGGPPAAAAAAAGLAAGLAWRLDLLACRSWRLPALVEDVLAGGLLGRGAGGGRVYVAPPPGGARGGAGGGAGGGGAARPRAPRVPPPPAVPRAEALAQLEAMGFARGAAEAALDASGGSVEAAVQRLL